MQAESWPRTDAKRRRDSGKSRKETCKAESVRPCLVLSSCPGPWSAIGLSGLMKKSEKVRKDTGSGTIDKETPPLIRLGASYQIIARKHFSTVSERWRCARVVRGRRKKKKMDEQRELGGISGRRQKKNRNCKRSISTRRAAGDTHLPTVGVGRANQGVGSHAPSWARCWLE